MNKMTEACINILENAKKVKRNQNIKKKDKKLFYDKNGVLINENSIEFVQFEKIIDSDVFMKIYIKGMDSLFDLSKTAQNVLNVVMKIAQHEKNNSLLFISCAIGKECGYNNSKSAFSKGLIELISKGILFEKRHPAYYYNPEYFFNGDRIIFLQNYLLEKKE